MTSSRKRAKRGLGGLALAGFAVLAVQAETPAAAETAPETQSECVVGDDPDQGGFFRGIRNLTGKRGYKCRLQDREDELSAEQGRRQSLLDRAAELQTENDQLEMQLQSSQVRLQKMAGELEALRVAIAAETDKRNDAALQLAGLEQRFADASAQMNLVKASYTAETMSTSEALDDIQEISSTLDDLESLVAELSDGGS